MHSLLNVMVVALSLTAAAQQASNPVQTRSHKYAPDPYLRMTWDAHKNGDTEKEIEYRRKMSDRDWSPHDSNAFDKYEEYSAIDNDISLAILLEGSHRWQEAEELFRHSQEALSGLAIAGNDIKSDNDLLLAHLLFLERNTAEASKICSYWKGRVKHNADRLLWAAKHDVPSPGLYDTPAVEIGAWDLACGKTDEGLGLLRKQIALYPEMDASYKRLSDYYCSEGEFAEGLRIENAWLKDLQLRSAAEKKAAQNAK